MKNKSVFFVYLIFAIFFSIFAFITQQTVCASPLKEDKDGSTFQHPDSYWKNKLDANTYQVTRCSTTEPAFQNKYWNNHEQGQYVCSNCGAPLFQSKDKFDSGTGWPSFTQSAKPNALKTQGDSSFGMQRTEVICRRCGAHLGHVFQDGPPPTGERFCINSASLNFEASNQNKTQH